MGITHHWKNASFPSLSAIEAGLLAGPPRAGIGRLEELSWGWLDGFSEKSTA
jgi:hypothetical protein